MLTRPLAEVSVEVDALADIDLRIKPLVVGLRRFGLCTTMSCEGHYTDGWFRFPWVDVDISGIETLIQLVQMQNRPDGDIKQRNQWVLMPYVIHQVRLMPMRIERPLRSLKEDAEDFGRILQSLAI